jgi:hypothetical protein
MDLFKAYPHLHNKTHYRELHARSLRLITVSGIVCDAAEFDSGAACYFTLSERRYWTRPSAERMKVRIGVGGVKARLFGRGKSASSQSPLQRLTGEIRRLGNVSDAWRFEVAPIPHKTTFLLEGETLTTLHHPPDVECDHPDRQSMAMPFLLVLTPPRLGGGVEVPDALVQAVYLLQKRGPTRDIQSSGLGPLKILQKHLGTFLARDEWAVEDLLAQPWAELTTPMPALNSAEAYFRPVLALRGLQRLWQEGLFPLDQPTKRGNP